MDITGKDQFPAYFNGMSYDDVMVRLTRGLPTDLYYKARIISASNSGQVFMLRFIGESNGTVPVYFTQVFDLSRGVTRQGDMTIDKDIQQRHVGTFLSYNALLLRQDMGFTHTEFTTDLMGGFAWARMGSLVNTHYPEWGKALPFICGELNYLCDRFGIAAPACNADDPCALWDVADIPAKGILDATGYFNRAASTDFVPQDVYEDCLMRRAAMMCAAYGTDPTSIRLGQLVLYEKKIPSRYQLQGDDDLTQRQWARINSYMAAKGYPGLGPA